MEHCDLERGKRESLEDFEIVNSHSDNDDDKGAWADISNEEVDLINKVSTLKKIQR